MTYIIKNLEVKGLALKHQWISTRVMVLVLMFLCDQSYTSHGRDFLLGVTILNSSAPFLVAYVTHVQTTPYEKNRE